ncbi:condensation domain-containing protein, partial [Bacillus spongiae]
MIKKNYVQTSPLSEGQKSFYTHYCMTPESSLYNERAAWNISTGINVPHFKQALIEVTKRHNMMRVNFIMEKEPVQKVYSEPILDFELIDMKHCDHSYIREYLDKETHRPFKLEEEPVYRFRLLEISSDKYIFLFMFHHIAGDGGTYSIILDEIGYFYNRLNEGKDLDLDSNVNNYSDFIDWQKDKLSGKRGEKLKSIWKNKLSGKLPVLDLPSDYRRPPVPSYRGNLFPFSLSDKVVNKLYELCKEKNTTLYAGLMSLYASFLYRYSGQEDLIIGTPVSGRNNKKFLSTAGYFVNILPIRVHVSEGISFSDFFDTVRKEMFSSIRYGEYPFPLMVEDVKANIHSSYSPVFQTSLVIQKDSRQKEATMLGNAKNIINVHGLHLEPIFIDKNVSKFDLTLFVEEEMDNSVCCNFEYNSDIFEHNTIARMASYFVNFVTEILDNPNIEISKVSLLDPTEQKQLLMQWNGIKAEYPRDALIHQLFEEQATRHPKAIAVVYENQQLTYEELNEQANQLAHY